MKIKPEKVNKILEELEAKGLRGLTLKQLEFKTHLDYLQKVLHESYQLLGALVLSDNILPREGYSKRAGLGVLDQISRAQERLQILLTINKETK